MILGHVVSVFRVFFEYTEDGPSKLFRTCILTYAVPVWKILENRLGDPTSLGVVSGACVLWIISTRVALEL